MTHARALSALVLLTLCACEDPKCVPLVYDRALDRCVCPAGTEWLMDENACLLPDGGVIPLPGDGGVRDGGVDDASVTPDACRQSAWYRDADEDGHGDPTMRVAACSAPDGYVATGNDCDDACSDCMPGGTEVCDGARDENCAGGVDEGCACTDGAMRPCPDGTDAGECVAGTQTCDGGAWSECAGAIGATADTCNGLDDDCDGMADEGVLETYYRDADGDSYGVSSMIIEGCTAPTGYVDRAGDCDDSCALCHPGAAETCDGIDNDCEDGTADEVRTPYYVDCDGDGYAATGAARTDACSLPPPRASTPTCASGNWTTRAPTTGQTDCLDSNSNVFPGQTTYFTAALSGVPANRDYDYNCDGLESQQYSARNVISCDDTCTTGWTGSTVPSCGQSSQLRVCFEDGSRCTDVGSRILSQGCR